MEKVIMVVTAAIIKKDGKYLITQRPTGTHMALKWEFPGGKLRFGEGPEDCLVREILEELGIKITVGEFFELSSYIYDEERHVILLGYLCKFLSGEIKEEVNYVWVLPKQMQKYDFCEADTLFVKKLQSGLS